jgi:hypothetical protein
MKAKRIYISGPMTGIPEYNFPAFHAAAERFRRAGWEVVNPAESFDGRTDLPRDAYMRKDVRLMVTCNAIAMLPMWRESQGARAEYLLALEIGMELLDADTMNALANPPGAVVVLFG